MRWQNFNSEQAGRRHKYALYGLTEEEIKIVEENDKESTSSFQLEKENRKQDACGTLGGRIASCGSGIPRLRECLQYSLAAAKSPRDISRDLSSLFLDSSLIILADIFTYHFGFERNQCYLKVSVNKGILK